MNVDILLTGVLSALGSAVITSAGFIYGFRGKLGELNGNIETIHERIDGFINVCQAQHKGVDTSITGAQRQRDSIEERVRSLERTRGSYFNKESM